MIRRISFPVVFGLGYTSSFAAFALLLVLAFRRTVLFALWLSLLFDYGSWASGTASSSTWRVTPSRISAMETSVQGLARL